MLRKSGLLLNVLGALALAVYLLVCALVLAGRYWILPNIDTWRPQITAYLSERYGLHIRAARITADWKGLNPTIVLTGVSLSSTGNVSSTGSAPQAGVLRVPRIRATLAWRSVLARSPVFANLDAAGIQLDLGRDEQGHFHAFGMSFGPDASPTSDMLPALLGWLSQQDRIVLSEATLRWTDALRAAPRLDLHGVTLALARHGGQRSFSLDASLPSQLGSTVTIRGVLQHVGNAPGAPSEAASAMPALGFPGEFTVDGDIYARIAGLRPEALAPWIDLPRTLSTEHTTLQLRAGVSRGQVKTLTTDVTLQGSNWHPGRGVQVAAQALRLYLDGPIEGYRQVFRPWQAVEDVNPGRAPNRKTPHLAYSLQGTGLFMQADFQFGHPIRLGRVSASGELVRPPDGPLRVTYQQAMVANADIQATVHGSWTQGGEGMAGIIDLAGQARRASLSAIVRYLPERVDEDARAWMVHGLLAGELEDADILLRGDLLHFPFAEQPQAGDFKVSGRYQGGVIDYLPPHDGTKGWPRLEAMRGTASLHRADLRLTATEAVVRPAAGAAIALRDVQARIPNIEHEPILTVKGNTIASASAYLALMKYSPLGGLLDDSFNDTSATGEWRVPLSLMIPLTRGEDTEVDGAIHFDGNAVRLLPDMPVLSDIRGTLNFSHRSVQADNLAGRFLGGKMAISGEIGAQGKGLRMEGVIGTRALAQYGNAKVLTRLQGVIPYSAVLRRGPDKSHALTISSSLKGLMVDLPQPLGKSADTAMPLKAVWRREPQENSRLLSVEIGSHTHALMRRDQRERGPIFAAVSIGVNQAPRLPATGLHIDAQLPEASLDVWHQVRRDIETPLRATPVRSSANVQSVDGTAADGHALFPPLSRLRLQSKHATFHDLALDQVTLTAQQSNPGVWRVDVSSTQTAGAVQWREVGNRIEGPVNARFNRMAIGTSSEKPADDGSNSDDAIRLLDGDEPLDIPAIDLHIQDLKLYGHHAGSLSLRGVNQSHGRLWRLDALHLGTGDGELNGSGLWRLSGPQRGLTIKATARFKNLGNYLEHAGFTGLVVGGSGTVGGEFEWRNMPWAFSRSDLNGKVEVDLAKGRFSSINSKSARLLELLSLQSVNRLARGQANPASLGRDGFPFDNLRGNLSIGGGMVTTRDYRVNGPAGTIVLEGSANIVDETLDMQAAVVPNLDISGAAIAAGIAINPIVGVGAFLTQLLLQTPLAKAMAVQYHITGPWSAPVINELAVPEKQPPSAPRAPALNN
ncbi:TIGR02099 family protein [Pusillimonas sp. TS35]|nr:TIGR02099 family protein [Pusillimonas sp. TS35]